MREADRVLARYLRPASLPREDTRRRFVESGDLERVLVLYTKAAEIDPTEPAHPWNLASSLRRLDQPQLALAFLEQAIRVAGEVGDTEWADEHAHIAWADTALAAQQFDVALVALARAKARARSREKDVALDADESVLTDIARLVAAVCEASGDDRRAAVLAGEIESLSA